MKEITTPPPHVAQTTLFSTPVQAATATHLERLPAVCIRARIAPLQDARQHHALHVGACQGQQVVQALVPGLKGPQARSVLAQALGHRPQQSCSAVPAGWDPVIRMGTTWQEMQRHMVASTTAAS